MRFSTNASSRVGALKASKPGGPVSVATKQLLLDNLTRYKVGSFSAGRVRDAGFSSLALATALNEVNKHLVEGPEIKSHQKARWVYCCNAAELVGLAELMPQIGDELEYFYLGGTLVWCY